MSNQSRVQQNLIPFDEVERMSKAVASSGLFGMKNPAQAIALMLFAQSEGLHPMIAVRDYHIMNGRPTSIKKMRHSMLTITLRQILDAGPCYDPRERYCLEKLALDEPISFREIVEVAGGQDAIWCFAVVLPGHEALKRHYAVDCAERVRHLMDDPRSLSALNIARRHALGQATDEELAQAQAAARAAARADARAAAARAADWAAARAAAARADEAVWAAARADEAVWAADWADEAVWAAAARADEAVWAADWADEAARAAAEAEIRWQGQRLIEITEAGVWTPVEEADKRG